MDLDKQSVLNQLDIWDRRLLEIREESYLLSLKEATDANVKRLNELYDEVVEVNRQTDELASRLDEFSKHQIKE